MTSPCRATTTQDIPPPVRGNPAVLWRKDMNWMSEKLSLSVEGLLFLLVDWFAGVYVHGVYVSYWDRNVWKQTIRFFINILYFARRRDFVSITRTPTRQPTLACATVAQRDLWSGEDERVEEPPAVEKYHWSENMKTAEYSYGIYVHDIDICSICGGISALSLSVL